MRPHGINSSDPRQRLLALSQERGTSLSALSRLIGRNETYLQQFIRKGSPKHLLESDRRTLAEFFGVAESEIGGPEEISYNPSVKLPLSAQDQEWIMVPRLPLGASAGPGSVSSTELPFDNFGFSRRWLREQGLEAAQLSAIRVEGDSMEPLLRAGDEILVDRAPRPFRDGVHVVRLGDTLVVKRVAALGAGRLSLLSQNMAYPPVEVGADEVEIIGRVVWKSGRL